jgi:hypothetical protein
MSHQLEYQLSQTHDIFLMDAFCSCGRFTGGELQHLNAVRMLYLKVMTLSDITSADGKTINVQLRLDHKHINILRCYDHASLHQPSSNSAFGPRRYGGFFQEIPPTLSNLICMPGDYLHPF